MLGRSDGPFTSEIGGRLQLRQLEYVRRRLLNIEFIRCIFYYIFFILTGVFIIFEV
jgi:hypothetical protein